MKTLWIDSENTPPEKNYTQIFSLEDFKTEIDYNGLPDEIWFGVSNGYECADYLVDYCTKHNCATPRYHLQQMKLEEARKIIYLIEDYNLNYVKDHGISEEELIKHFINIIGNTNIEKIGSITYAINKHEKELEALLPLEDNLRKEISETINRDNQTIITDLCTQLNNYDKTIKEYIKASKFAKEVQIPTKISQLENDSGYLTTTPDTSSFITKEDIPTKISQLENDSGYLTTTPDTSSFITKEEVEEKLLNKVDKLALNSKANKNEIPTKVSQLENDSGYLTKDSNFPTKVSQLENDSGYLLSKDISSKVDINFLVQLIVDYAKIEYVQNYFATKEQVKKLEERIKELENSNVN